MKKIATFGTSSLIVAGLFFGSVSLNATASIITSSGSWLNPTGTASNVTGVGTNEISWGNPQTLGGQSSWVFEGLDNVEVGDLTSGSPFALGQFTHNNFPITNYDFTGADLDLDLTIAGNVISNPLVFTFGHNETANVLPCNPLGITVCPDVVTIPMATASELISIDGNWYELTIGGFELSFGSGILTEFVTEEGSSNTATLFASLDTVSVPEPSVLALMGFGLVGLGFGRRRKA